MVNRGAAIASPLVSHTVLGVDGCRSGWIGIVPHAGGALGYFGATIAELVAAADPAGEAAVVAIDIPIGLPDAGPRRADIEARAAIGARRASVFLTPARAALRAADHAAAVRISRELTGEGVSIQAFSLRAKIFEVDSWVRTQPRRVVEVHPELSFAQMAGAPLAHSKVTWAGVERRRALLAAAGIDLAGELGDAGRAARVDDVLDAAAAAWTARRVAAGTAVCRPSRPEVYSDGLPCAIWA